MNPFSIPEIIILLALHEEKGSTKFVASFNLEFAIAGAILAEMKLKKIIEFEAKKVILKKDNADDVVIAKAIEMIADKPNNKTIAYWIDKLSSKSNRFKKICLQKLCNEGIVKKVESKILGLIPIAYYPLRDPIKKRQIENTIGEYVMRQDLSDERINTILILLKAVGMIGYVLDKNQKCKIGTQLKEMVKNDLIAKEVKSAIGRRAVVTGGV